MINIGHDEKNEQVSLAIDRNRNSDRLLGMLDLKYLTASRCSRPSKVDPDTCSITKIKIKNINMCIWRFLKIWDTQILSFNISRTYSNNFLKINKNI